MSTLEVVTTSKTQLSFSGIIDNALAQSGEVTSIDNYEGYLNSVIREMQSRVHDPRDLVETQVLVTANPMIVPLPANFRNVLAIRYTPGDIEPTFVLPGPKQKCVEFPYYISGQNFVFGNVQVGGYVKLAYYTWARALQYYPRPDALIALQNSGVVSSAMTGRPAYYDDDAHTWMYLQADKSTYAETLPTEDAMALARARSGNWLVTDWSMALKAGLISAVFTARGDTQKSAPYYSQYRTWLTLFEGSPLSNR